MKTVILSAPQGWGKTRNATALQREFRCARVVDGWHPSQGLTAGALHLTHLHGSDIAAQMAIDPAQGVSLVTRGWQTPTD